MNESVQKIFYFLVFFIIVGSNQIYSQDVKVKNIVPYLEDDKVKITFDLQGDKESKYEVKLYISSLSNKFEKYEAKPNSVIGDVNNKETTTGEKQIIWTPFGLEWLSFEDGDIRFEITAEEISSGGIPWYAYAGGALAAAVVAIVVIISGDDESDPEGSDFAVPPIRP